MEIHIAQVTFQRRYTMNAIKFLLCASVLLMGLLIAPSRSSEGDAEWGYAKSDDWTEMDDAECDGEHQSPIDLIDICENNTRILVDKSLVLTIENYNETVKKDRIRLKNNGHSAVIHFDDCDQVQDWAPRLMGNAVEQNTYQLIQVHFHWDRVSHYSLMIGIDFHLEY